MTDPRDSKKKSISPIDDSPPQPLSVEEWLKKLKLHNEEDHDKKKWKNLSKFDSDRPETYPPRPFIKDDRDLEENTKANVGTTGSAGGSSSVPAVTPAVTCSPITTHVSAVASAPIVASVSLRDLKETSKSPIDSPPQPLSVEEWLAKVKYHNEEDYDKKRWKDLSKLDSDRPETYPPRPFIKDDRDLEENTKVNVGTTGSPGGGASVSAVASASNQDHSAPVIPTLVERVLHRAVGKESPTVSGATNANSGNETITNILRRRKVKWADEIGEKLRKGEWDNEEENKRNGNYARVLIHWKDID